MRAGGALWPSGVVAHSARPRQRRAVHRAAEPQPRFLGATHAARLRLSRWRSGRHRQHQGEQLVQGPVAGAARAGRPRPGPAPVQARGLLRRRGGRGRAAQLQHGRSRPLQLVRALRRAIPEEHGSQKLPCRPCSFIQQAWARSGLCRGRGLRRHHLCGGEPPRSPDRRRSSRGQDSLAGGASWPPHRTLGHAFGRRWCSEGDRLPKRGRRRHGIGSARGLPLQHARGPCYHG
mmetsp:Transcript_88431/g.249187  ORF Transcript_88431/g.249187 Transcript_88431/m.249187 type:complete len:233 (-) Transcript_88431:190-888(-)